MTSDCRQHGSEVMNDDIFVLRVRRKPKYTELETLKLHEEASADLGIASELTWLHLRPANIMTECL